MNTLIENFNNLCPLCAACPVDGDCIIDEHDNENRFNVFQRLIITDFKGWQFPHDLPNKLSASYCRLHNPTSNNNCHKVVRLSCDSILCIEEEGKIIFYVCELKSSYDKDQIVHAREQIVGSYIKILALLNTLQGFDMNRIEMRGVIFAYEMNPERLSIFKNTSEIATRFCLKLYEDKIYNMPSSNCESYWYPLSCPDVKLILITVPNLKREHTISFKDIK